MKELHRYQEAGFFSLFPWCLQGIWRVCELRVALRQIVSLACGAGGRLHMGQDSTFNYVCRAEILANRMQQIPLQER